MSTPEVYIALIHYPILNKEGRTITTSVTNFDLHDLARTATTFNVKGVFIVTPNPVQINMIHYIKQYWHEGTGAEFNPDRKQAFDILEPLESIEKVRLTIKSRSGKMPSLVVTTAKRYEKSVGYSELSKELQQGEPTIIAFGTGHGLAPEFMESADKILAPIEGLAGYNHLPVRGAVAIILDRLLGIR